MNIKKITGYQIILYMISIYHVMLGIISLLPITMALSLLKSIFDMTFELSPQMIYIAKLTGIYMLVFGFLIGYAAYKNIKSVWIVYTIVGLYALRIIHRFFNQDVIVNSFGSDPSILWIQVVLLAFFGIATYVLSKK